MDASYGAVSSTTLLECRSSRVVVVVLAVVDSTPNGLLVLHLPRLASGLNVTPFSVPDFESSAIGCATITTSETLFWSVSSSRRPCWLPRIR